MKLALIIYAVLFVTLAEVLGGELGRRRSSVFSDMEKEWQHSFFRRRDEEEDENNVSDVTETEETEETTASSTERAAQTTPVGTTEETTASTEAPEAGQTGGVGIGVGAIIALAMFGLLLILIFVSCAVYVRCLLMLLRHPLRVRGTTGRANRRIN